jgi:F0F1-type ATP synthase epsilon subunit
VSSPATMTLRILTPEGVIFEVDALEAIRVPIAVGGTIGLRPGHAPLIAETSTGAVKYRSDPEAGEISLHPGILDIRDNQVTILTAGEVLQTPDAIVKPVETDFDRLMQTLVRELNPQPEIENDQAK